MSEIGIGETLRAAREEQGRTIEEAARDTRVRADHLRALEEEQFGAFGGDVYAKGFLSSYARYLKLDPAPLLESYRRYVQHDDYDTAALASGPAARGPAGPPPTWVAWAIVAVFLLAGAVALVNVFGGRAPSPADDADTPPQPVATDTETEPPAERTPSPSPTPTFEGVNLVLAFEDRSWIRVSVDGEHVSEGTIEPGEALSFEGSERIEVRLGNAGAVRVELNGEDLGTLGGRGEVVDVTFTEEGADTG